MTEIKDIPFDIENLNLLELIGGKTADLSRFLGVNGDIVFITCIWDGLTNFYTRIADYDQALQEKELTRKQHFVKIWKLKNEMLNMFSSICDTISTVPEFNEMIDDDTKSSIKKWREAYKSFIENTEKVVKE